MDYQKLENLFESDPPIAIEASQKMICSVSKFDSFKDFFTYHLENAHMSTCQNEWSDPQLCVYCIDCSVIHPACVCLPCFLNGNHENHNYVILNTTGNCDCGDSLHWKRSGFCSKHHGLDEDNNHPEDYLDKELQTVLTDVIFKAAFMSLKQFTRNNLENAEIIIQFISSFLKFGDGFRRLIALSMTEKFDLEAFLRDIPDYSTDFNQLFQQLCGGLVNDQLFIRHFSKITYKIFSDRILKDSSSIIVSGNKNVSYRDWNNFWFHSFAESVARYHIEHENWDWVTFFSDSLSYFKELLNYVGNDHYNEMPKQLTTLIYHIAGITKIQPNEQTQKFFDILATQVLATGSDRGQSEEKKNNTIIVTSFKEDTERFHYFCVFHFQLFFNQLFYCFSKKPNLKIDKLIEMLDKTIDISPIFMIGKNSVGKGNGEENENDKFIEKFVNSKNITDTFSLNNYKSFHNGGSFFINFPLFDSLVSLFKVDTNIQTQVARLLSSEKYQNLRVKLGIVTLKSILSFICHRQMIAAANNKSIMMIYDVYNNPDMLTKFFSRFVPVFQLLIGLQCVEKNLNYEFSLKEFFAFEMAREIGLFDDLTSEEYEDENINEKQKQMVFSFLYLSLMLVIERTLFYYNGYNFIQEQIIFALKKGVHSIDELNKMFDNSALDSMSYMWAFNDILMKVATSTNTKRKDDNQESSESSKTYNQDVSFYLKDGVEWKTISAVNSLNEQMTLMNDEISKNADKLIKIPDFEPEEEFFFHSNKKIVYEDYKLNDNENENENENNNVELNTDGLNVRLKQFLLTPTVLAVVYHALRTNCGKDSNASDLNDHLAMNILILASKFVEDEEEKNSSFDESTTIEYESVVDLISKLKRAVFGYHSDDSSIECTMNKKSFVSLLKMKISSNDLPPKSMIDVLLNKGKLGRNVLEQMSRHVHLDCLDDENEQQKQDTKADKHKIAAKLKQDIMNHYKNLISNYNASDHLQQKGGDSLDEISSVSNSMPFNSDENKDVCSICSTYKKNEIFSYPLFIYRTKFPFIIDKPPLVSKNSPCLAVYDNDEDFESKKEVKNDDEEEEEEEIGVDPSQAMAYIIEQFPQLLETDGLSEEEAAERQNTFTMILNTILEQQIQQSKKKRLTSTFVKKFDEFNKKEKEEIKRLNDKDEFKRSTIGANFILQFGICQHPVHLNCVKDKVFTCPIDRSVKNALLPSIEDIPKSVVFNSNEPLALSVIDSISSFLDNFSSFFDCIKNNQLNIFIELIKSISGMVSTFEIRLRSLPDCLDSEKTKLLTRNLFLTTWFAYRIKNKPKIAENEEIGRLTMFQQFIKDLIENDVIENSDKKEEKLNEIKKIISSIIEKNNQLNDIDICLFLRRVCLAEYFLIGNDVNTMAMQDIIDWDEVLSPSNLSERYEYKFANIDDEIEFKPFSFMKLPKQFLHLAKSPFNLPIEKTETLSLFNLIDYNYLIRNYDNASGEIKNVVIDEEINKNKRNLATCEPRFLYDFLHAFYGKRHYPSVVIFTGKFASQVFLVVDDYFASLNPFYVDKYGCNDVGYKRSQPLFLNEERCDRLIDLVLSGDFAYSLNSLYNMK